MGKKSVNLESSVTKNYGYGKRKRVMRGKGLNRKQLMQVKKQVEKKLNEDVEVKIFDVSFTDTEVASFSASSSAVMGTKLSQIVRGTTDLTRIGNEIVPKYFQLRGSIFTGTASTDQVIQGRFLIWQYRDSDDGVTVGSQLLDLLIDAGGGGQHAFNNYSKKNASSYKVLYDQKIIGVASGGNPDNCHLLDITIPGKSLLKLDFEEGAVTGHNMLACAFVFDRVQNAINTTWSEEPQLDFQCRLGFTDM